MVAIEKTLNGNNRATHYLPRCKTLRVGVGRSISDLAKHSEVDRATITKIERNHPVTEHIAHRVLSALNVWHKGNLQPHTEITNTPRK